MDIGRFTAYKHSVIENCSKVIIGKDDSIFLVLICFVCRGHVLIEDIPGTGKTMLLRSFAKTIGGDFKRIQFTPDLLPSDLTGINFYNQKVGDFQFRPGPLFTNIVLADEINRATPRTQSSLLEAMEERQITVDGKTTILDEPFMVMATQNPLESYGTFPLPEAQTDRFFMRLSLGYMNREQELSVISRPSTLDIVESLKQTVTNEETAYIRAKYIETLVSEDVSDYIMDIIEATRKESKFIAGVSTRGAIALYKASQACAAMNGRDYVIPEDVRFVAPHILTHRLSMGSTTKTANYTEILNRIINKAEVPLEDV
ncbi:MAG: MoxR family ATPase [Treponema sp.]|nr:MoxR family ATPase [Treponema sp.]